ncbi:hypothetical protein ACFLU1_01590 [Chloroflexota bacterium]
MRGLCSAFLVSAVLMSLVFGASPALAQTERDNKEKADVSVEEGSDNQTATKEEAIKDRTTTRAITEDTEPIEELDRLMKLLEEAEREKDKELINALQRKIQVIKGEVRKATVEPIKPQLATEKSLREVPREESVVSFTNIDKCDELKAWESKRTRYATLYALADEEIKAKGYRGGKEEVRKIIAELDEGIKRLRIECEAGVTTRTGGTAVAVTLKPTIVESGGEIIDYYKRRIAEIATKGMETEKQIASLKELRNEIDRLIEELIKSKDKISIREVSELVTRIEVKPGELKMDKAVVRTIDKSVVARINNRELEIKPTERHVIIRDANLEVKASELSIENEVIRVGNSEVKVMPSTVIEKIQVEPREMELKEENAKAVYRIKADEKRKLFGFIPVKIERTLTVDAADTEVKVDEKGPWWAFLTTK